MIEIQANFKRNYVHVSCTGTFSSGAMLEVWESAFRSAIAQCYKAILVDIRSVQGEPPNVVERFDHGVRIAELQRLAGNDILIGVVGDEPMIDPDRLDETIARNHGAFISIFADIAEAIDWIKTEIANARELENSLRWRSGLRKGFNHRRPLEET